MSMLEKIIDHHPRVGVPFQLNNQSAILVRLVSHRRNVGDDLFIHQPGNLLLQSRPVYIERNLGDDQLLPRTLELLDADCASELHTPASSVKVVLDSF